MSAPRPPFVRVVCRSGGAPEPTRAWGVVVGDERIAAGLLETDARALTAAVAAAIEAEVGRRVRGSLEGKARERLPDVIGSLMTCVRVAVELEKKSDEEIATLLDEHVLSGTSMLSPAYEVIEQAVTRLRERARGAARAGGDDRGPL